MRRSLSFVLLMSCALFACDKVRSFLGPEDVDQPSTTSGTDPAVPSVDPLGLASDAAGLGPDPNLSELDQSKQYEAKGQLWLARLILEKKALGDNGTPDEVNFLAKVCDEQNDDACLDACNKKLGGKLKIARRDAGRSTSSVDAGIAPMSDYDLAGQYVSGGNLKKGRQILEPKVLENRATPDEIRLLSAICTQQKDKICISFCASRLNGQ